MALEYLEPWLIYKGLRAEGSRNVDKIKVTALPSVSSQKLKGLGA